MKTSTPLMFSADDVRKASILATYRALEARGLSCGQADLKEVREALVEWFEQWRNELEKVK